MQVQWKKLLAKTIVWLAAEILLSLLGLDNLADYSEFLLVRDSDNVVVFKRSNNDRRIVAVCQE